MAQPKLNIVTAFAWLSNTLDTQELSASEQLTLLHLVKFLNRNFWRAVEISNHKLARAIGKDDRTTKKAIESLVQKNLIIQKKGALHIGIDGAEKHFTADTAENDADTAEPDRAAQNAENDTKQSSKVRTLADYI